jgi:SMI1 / KNR4 family (SUKH-1)
MALKNLNFTKHAPFGAKPEEIAAAEAKLNARFPAEFIEFCFRWNGGVLSPYNQFCPVPASFTDFHTEYKQTQGVLIITLYGISENFPQANLLKKEYLLNARFDFGIIPIGADLLGNQVVVRAELPSGLVYWKDKDLWEATQNPTDGPQFAEKPRLIPIAENLESFYNSLGKEPS